MTWELLPADDQAFYLFFFQGGGELMHTEQMT